MTAFPPPNPVGVPHQDEPAETEDDLDSIGQRQLTKRTATDMSAMEVTRPELLRATRAYSALQCCGRALHHSFSGDLHHRSFQTDSFDCFWSHSWHGSSWQKILLLMVVYNGRAALIAGNVAAILGMSLFYLELLPSGQHYQLAGADYHYGPWGFVLGLSATFCMLFVWQPRSKIFLDRICIHQVNEDRKKQGILSLGGFLRRSGSMLVLWDATYPTRLWTVFELAAFLKSHGDESHLLIRPTILGPTAIALFVCVAVSFVGQTLVLAEQGAERPLQQPASFLILSVLLVHLLRGYLEWVENCLLQLRSFSLAETTTHCCSSDHKDGSGDTIICDREILLECMRVWFGSDEEFERCVRSQVSSALAKGLGRRAFPFAWFVGINSALLWGYGDFAVSALRGQSFYFFLVSSLDAFSTAWAYGCVVYVAVLHISHKLRRRRAGVMNYFVSFLGGCGLAISLLVPRLLRPFLERVLQDVLLGAVAWAATMGVFAVLALQLQMWRVTG